MSRPTLYEPKTVRKIIRALENGCNNEEAARYAGIDESTFYRWREQYCEFCEACTRARDSLKPRLLQIAADAALKGKDANVALRLLKLLFPNDFAAVHKIQGDPEQPLQVELSESEERAALTRKPAGLPIEKILDILEERSTDDEITRRTTSVR